MLQNNLATVDWRCEVRSLLFFLRLQCLCVLVSCKSHVDFFIVSSMCEKHHSCPKHCPICFRYGYHARSPENVVAMRFGLELSNAESRSQSNHPDHVIRCVSVWHVFSCVECIKFLHDVKRVRSTPLPTLAQEMCPTMPLHRASDRCSVSHSTLHPSLWFLPRILVHHRPYQFSVSLTLVALGALLCWFHQVVFFFISVVACVICVTKPTSINHFFRGSFANFHCGLNLNWHSGKLTVPPHFSTMC